MLGGEGVDTVWVEALPVLPAREEYDGNALEAQLPDDLGGFLVCRDIPLHEVNVQIVQTLLSEPARIARGRREDSNQGGSFEDWDGIYQSIR